MSFWRCYYHIIWATKNREPMLDAALRPRVYALLGRLCQDKGIRVFQIGGIEDHMHMVVSIPPRLSVSETMGYIKGRSSSILQNDWDMPEFNWQEGYGVLTFGEKRLEQVVGYVRDQSAHHRDNSLFAGMERWDGE